jgi:cytochrome b6-f complex iron-sulfur subunit
MLDGLMSLPASSRFVHLVATPLLGPWDKLGIVVGAIVLVIALGVAGWSTRRHPTSGPSATGAAHAQAPPEAGSAGTAATGAADVEASPAPATMTRRTLVERGVLGVFVAALAGVVTASVDYVVRAVGSDRGRTYAVGTADDIRAHMRSQGPVYDPVGRFYVVPYPVDDLTAARHDYGPGVLAGMEVGFVALDQACTHLGCRVPWCPSSQWFECPCHGSQYNAVGEQQRGPAPRGLDRYRVTVLDGKVMVDTGHKYLGPPPGTDTTGQRPAGPHCS